MIGNREGGNRGVIWVEHSKKLLRFQINSSRWILSAVAASNCSTFALKLILQSNQVCKIKHVRTLICFQYRFIFQTVLLWDPTALWISHLSTTRHSPPVHIDYFHIQTFQVDWSHQSVGDENGWSHTEINLSYSLVAARGATRPNVLLKSCWTGA